VLYLFFMMTLNTQVQVRISKMPLIHLEIKWECYVRVCTDKFLLIPIQNVVVAGIVFCRDIICHEENSGRKIKRLLTKLRLRFLFKFLWMGKNKHSY
jgi:hypothetical protein